jgi:hypothetical protein
VPNAAGYFLERSTDAINWTTIATPGAAASSYSDSTGLLAERLYYYRLTATNLTQISPATVVNAQTPSRFTNWQYSASITFGGYSRGGTLTNFPALVSIGTNISGFNWTQFSSTNGFELRFSDNNGYELPYEHDKGTNLIWTNSVGFGQVWVLVPSLSASTVITAHWGNPAATNAIPAYCTNGAVWTNGFGGVWHLPDGVTLKAGDSTSNRNNGTITSATATTGQIGGAASFNGTTAHIDVGNSATVNPSSLTYSAWVKPSGLANAYSSVISKSEGGRVGTLLIKSNGKLACYVGASGGVVNYDGAGNSTLSTGQWYYLTMAYDAANGLKGYVNGVADGSAAANGAILTGADLIWIGAHPSITGRYINGIIDEPRISIVARDANWIWAEWMNMASNSVFTTYGPSVNGALPHLLQLTQFQLWQSKYFTAEELADSSISGASARANPNGLDNLLQYAFALSPWETNTSALPQVGQWTDPVTHLTYLTLTYRQNTRANDLIFTPQATDDFKGLTWSTDVEEMDRESFSDYDVVTVRDTIPMSNANQRFLRLLVIQQ